MDREVPLDPNTGIFVTMNPAGKKYGGRQKLPDNLKQLFRPVAMSKPDNEIIAEVSLYSEGFKDAKNLGHKLVSIFNLSTRYFLFFLPVYKVSDSQNITVGISISDIQKLNLLKFYPCKYLALRNSRQFRVKVYWLHK